MTPHESFPWIWRWKSRLPERKGEVCRVIVRGRMNSVLVEFHDGFRVVTSRYAVQRRNRKGGEIRDQDRRCRGGRGPAGDPRCALVTAVWKRTKPNPEVFPDGLWDDARAKEAEAQGRPLSVLDKSFSPGINAVLVSEDQKRDDPYGRQTERESSIPHQSNQVAHGFYWRRLDDQSPLTPYQGQELGPGVAH